VGILNCGVQHENDPAYALLHDFVDKQDPVVRIGAIMGLGLAYAGTRKEEVGLRMCICSIFCQSKTF
jgi:26S proteasome regulatory subunit N1